MANDFKNLLSAAIGKDFADIGKIDVENWAGSQGWRNKDVKRIVKGFTKFSKRDNNFNLTAPGEFRIEGVSGSGRRKGNVKGFDLGDIVGLGRDVSLLGGALETTLNREPLKEFNSDFGEIPKVSDALSFGDKQFIDYKGASGQQGSQQRGQEEFQNNKDSSSKEYQVGDGVGDPAYSPSEIFDASTNPFLKRSKLGLLNPDPNDFGGNVKLGDALNREDGSLAEDDDFNVKSNKLDTFDDFNKYDIHSLDNGLTGEEYRIWEAWSKKHPRIKLENDWTGIPTMIANVKQNIKYDRPKAPQDQLITGTPTIDVAGLLDRTFDTTIKDIPIVGALLSDVGAGGIKNLGYQVSKGSIAPMLTEGTGAYKGLVKDALNYYGIKGRNVIEFARNLGKKLSGKIKSIAELTPIEQKIFNFIRRKIPESRRLPQQAESLKNVITTPRAATRVGNVGFRPKINRFGGKIKFSR